MIYHILNGDALAEKFPSDRIEGQVIIIREAFMEGPVTISFDQGYWERRTAFVADTFEVDPESYERKFGSQLQLLDTITSNDTVYLWFEDDLFCQVNMWFAINYILKHAKPSFYRVFPEEDIIRWRGFGNANSETLEKSYSEAHELWNGDLGLIQKIWRAYVENNFEKLTILGNTTTLSMRHLPAVIAAHIDRCVEDESQRQPQKLLREIIAEGHQGFENIFSEFSLRAGIYGYGDVQVRQFLEEIERRE